MFFRKKKVTDIFDHARHLVDMVCSKTEECNRLEGEIERLQGELADEKKNHQLTYLQTRDCVVKACAFVEDYLHTRKPDPATVRIQVDINEETLTEGWYPHQIKIGLRTIGECE